VPLEFLIYIKSFRSHCGPGVDSASNRNEYREHFLGVKTACEIGLEVSADKNKYMVMSGVQNAGRIQSVRMDNSTSERVEEFKYLGTTLTHQNSIAEEIKSRLRPGNACYHSVQNLLSSRLLSKNLKIKIYTTKILLFFCMGVKLGR